MQQRVAAVTGASRGIGKAVAVRLSQAGFKVLLLSRPSPELDQVLKELHQQEQQHEIVHIDLLDAAQCGRVLHGRRVDVLVNCAIYQGVGENARFDALEVDEYSRLLTGNVLSQVALIKSCLPGMLERNAGGSVFQLVSASSRVPATKPVDKGGFQAFGYVSTKTAIGKLVPLLHLEHNSNSSSVLFFNIDPGLVITDKMRREGTAERFLKYGASDAGDTAEVIAQLALASVGEAAAGSSSVAALARQHSGKEFVHAPSVLAELTKSSKM